ncbi:MAG: S8 family serine peptidase [Acidobacteriota bacterium]
MAAGVVLLASVAVTAWPAEQPAWTGKVDPWVLGSAHFGETEFIVFLAEQADLSGAAGLATKDAKGRFVTARLREVAARTQPALIQALASRGVEYRPYWVANMIWVRGGMDTIQAMAERSDVARVSANPMVNIGDLRPAQQPSDQAAPESIEWNITKVHAPSVWALGYTGQGVVVAGQDTGYQWDHPALKTHYRGWNGATADHNYNWHDAIHSCVGNPCGCNLTVPCDDYGHGTHTMGTMVGDDGGSNQIGMAPGAKWIGCRNMDDGTGSPTTYSECFQWFIAPTDLNGQNPDPSKAPDVISNSWGCPPSEGCTDPLVLQTVVANTVAAGIVVVVSAGNSGSSCSSVVDPPAIYGDVISVGATDSSDNIASFSSRGPVTIDGSGRLKPDVSAPGVSIRSSVPPSTYQGGWSGTSMAAPHVTGEVALLLSAFPSWIGQVDQIATRIEQTAVPRTTSQTCGGVPGSTIPNNTYGWGRIDALNAVSMANLGIAMTASPDPVAVGGQLVYTIQISNAGPVDATSVTLTDPLPANTVYVGSSLSCSNTAGTLTCPVGTVAKNTQVEATITLSPNAGGTLTNTVTVAATEGDPDTSDNQATTVTSVIYGADLAVTGTTSPDPVLVGTDLTYSLTVSNSGPAVASAATLTDVLPAGVTFVSASAGCADSSGTVSCALGDLASGASVPVTIVVSPTVPGTLLDSPAVASATPDPNAGNNVFAASTSVVAATPAALEVDGESTAGTDSNVNGVLEPGETVLVRPAWANPSAAGVPITGTAADFTGPTGADYSLLDGLASYGTVPPGGAGTFCVDCYLLGVSAPPARPSLHWDATFDETLAPSGTKTWTVHVGHSFSDVPPAAFAYRFIETIFHHGITAGCGGDLFCPTGTVNRWQMAVFLATAQVGSNVPVSGTVPNKGDYNCVAGGTSVFADVAPEDPGCRFIHYIAAEGVTAGCGDGLHYCPAEDLTRWQMGVFLAVAVSGGDVPVSGVVPNMGPYDCVAGGTSVFTDVAPDDPGCRFIHYIAAQQITVGCGNSQYCPAESLPRNQMAVFLSAGFHLGLYGP